MAESYAPVEGTNDEVVSTDSDAVRGELGIVNFNLSTDSGTYSLEQKITNYIGNIFKAYDSAKEYFDECKNIASTYQDKVDIVVEPESPIQASVFDQYLETEAVVDINSGSLNVRSDASTSSEVVTQLKKGDSVKVIGYDANSEWTKVEINGETRYVATKYLKLSDGTTNGTSQQSPTVSTPSSASAPSGSSSGGASPQPTASVAKGEYTIKLKDPNSSLRVRSTPGINDSNIIGKLNHGDKIKVLEYQENGWSKIEYNGQSAYVYSKYLQ